MARYEKSTFQGDKVLLDDNEFIDCTFENCELVFAGTGDVSLSGNVFRNVKWSFDGAAGRTLQFLKAMYRGAGSGGRDLVEKTFASVREK